MFRKKTALFSYQNVEKLKKMIVCRPEIPTQSTQSRKMNEGKNENDLWAFALLDLDTKRH